MQVVQAPGESTILVIAAHPDDMESWCAGTVRLAIEAGCRAHLLLTTAGDKGSNDPEAIPAELGRQRTEEARQAASHLGFSTVQVLDWPDGEVENTMALRREIVGTIRRLRPRTVFTFDPEQPLPRYLSHRDHRATGRAALDAIYPLARDPLNFPELLAAGLQPHKVAEVWLFASASADSYVDISATLERKIEARLLHASQTADPAALPESWRERARRLGEPAGLDAAEIFTVLTIN